MELFEYSRNGNIAGVKGLLLALQVLSNDRDESAVDYRDKDGMTILHWAAREGHEELVKYLITSAGADVLDRDSAGGRASGHARAQYFMQLAKFLESKEFNVLHHISRLQSTLRRYAHRLEFTNRRQASVVLECVARRAVLAALQGGQMVSPYTAMWWSEGEEGRHALAREMQRRVRFMLDRRGFVMMQIAGQKLAALTRMRLARMLYFGTRVFCKKAGQDADTVITKMMGGTSKGWRKVTPLWRTREYLDNHKTMRGIHTTGIESMKMQKTEREQFEGEVHRLAALKVKACVKIQSLRRGIMARQRVRRLEAHRSLERQAALAQREGKLFSLFSNGDNAVAMYVEWSVEAEVPNAPKRYRAVQDRAGGVFGVSVLVVRGTERVVKEREEKALAVRRRNEAEERDVEKRRQDERARVINKAAIVMQCWHRRLAAITRAGRLRAMLPKHKRPDPLGDVIRHMQNDYARAKMILWERSGEWDEAQRELALAKTRLGNAMQVLGGVDEAIGRCARLRRAAIAGRRHKEAGRVRAEWERLCIARDGAALEVEDLGPRMGEREREAFRLEAEVKELSRDVKRRKHQLEQYSYRKGRGRPPKHLGQFGAMQMREQRVVQGKAMLGRFGTLSGSEVEREASVTIQRVMRGHWDRLSVDKMWDYREKWRAAPTGDLLKCRKVQARVRGWMVRKRVRTLMKEMALAAKAKTDARSVEEEEEEYMKEGSERQRGEVEEERSAQANDEEVVSRLQAMEMQGLVQRAEERLSKGGWFMRRKTNDSPEKKKKQIAALVKKGNELRKDAFSRISRAAGKAENASLLLDEASAILDEAQAVYEDAGEHGRQGKEATAALTRAITDRRQKLAKDAKPMTPGTSSSLLSLLSKSRTPGAFQAPVSPVPLQSSPESPHDGGMRMRMMHLMPEDHLDAASRPSSEGGVITSSEGGVITVPRPPTEPRAGRAEHGARLRVVSIERGAGTVGMGSSPRRASPTRRASPPAPPAVPLSREEVMQHLSTRLSQVQDSQQMGQRYLGGDKTFSPRKEMSGHNEM